MHMLKLKETFQKHQSLVYLAIGAKLNCTGGGAKFVGILVGAWRSLVARTLGVREVAGSNPAAPTISSSQLSKIFSRVYFVLGNLSVWDCQTLTLLSGAI